MDWKRWFELPEEYLLWRRPIPWFTLAVVFGLGVAGYWIPRQDAAHLTTARTAYEQADLFRLEIAPYSAFVETRRALYGSRQFEDRMIRLNAVVQGKGPAAPLIDDLLNPPGFVAWMQAEGRDMLSAADFESWQQAREPVNRQVAELGLERLGLRSDRLEPYRLLSFALLSPSAGALVALLVLTLVAGQAPERRLGIALMAPLTGALLLLGGGLLTLLLPPHQTYGGALLLVSILCGLHMGCFWNKATATLLTVIWLLALAMAPSWSSGSAESHWVIAGLAALLYLLAFNTVHLLGRLQAKEHQRATPLPETPPERDPNAWEPVFREGYAEGLDCLSRMDFEGARRVFDRLAELYPEHPALVDQMFHLHKTSDLPSERLYWTRRALSLALKSGQPRKAARYWQEHLRYGGRAEELDEAITVHLVTALLEDDSLSLAEDVCQQLIAAPVSQVVLVESLTRLIDTLEREERTLRIEQYRRHLKGLGAL